MHLNDNSMESPTESQEMEAENRGVAERIVDLERKILEQGDELVCLKATLAEALRRLNVLEGMRFSNSTPFTPSTPIRINGTVKEPLRQRQISNSSSKIESQRKLFSGSSLPQRRAVHYQSTGSLHSDSYSSSSVSPIPSPSPRATPMSLNWKKQSSNTTSPSSAVVVNNYLHKRWNSTGDFNQSNLVAQRGMQSKFSTKLFLNLYTKANNSPMPSYKHGTKDATYNGEDKTLKIYLKNRPIILYAPTELSENYEITKISTAPSKKLKLDWVYGYRGKDCRSNLYFLPTGEMIYFVAAVVVLYNVEEKNQRHYVEHTDEIKSLAIHPNKMLVATGQCASLDKNATRPHIRVWNSVSLHTQAVIGMNDFNVSICCLSFSKADGGSLLLAIDEVTDHNISVWDWQKGENGCKIIDTKCSVDTIVAAEFHPLDRNAIVTCGKSHIAFWSLDVGGTLYKRMGIFETREKPKYVTCVAFLQSGETITGDSNGNLAIWGRGTNTIWKFIKNVHEGPIFTICVLKDGSVLTGGGKDGRIVEFSYNLTMTGVVSQIEGHFGGVRVISEGKGSQLLIGTTRNCILNGKPELGYQPIILGHTDELCGLASNPSVPQFVTGGHDKVLQLWDSMSHSIHWSKDIGEQIQSVAFSTDGVCILVGCTSGRWFIFDAQTRELLGQHTDSSEPIQVIQFCPDGTKVAIGSCDNQIYIYHVSEDGFKYNRVGRCTGHSSYISNIDWAIDNQTIRSNSGDYELLYWNTGTCRQIPQSSMLKDVNWATNNCTLTFTTVGIWPENGDGADINTCDHSYNAELMVTGDDFGKVKLYCYPVIQTKSLCHSYGGHSSHVTAVKFLNDDTRLVSIGGKDAAILQWIVS